MNDEYVPFHIYQKVHNERNRMIDRLRNMEEAQDKLSEELRTLGVRIGDEPKRKAISIEYLYKALTDELFNQRISSDTMAIIHSIVARWQDE